MSFLRRHSKSAEYSDPHTWQLPDSFRKWPTQKHSETIIPTRSIFRDVSLLQATFTTRNNPSTISYPTPGHVAVHLCLLECFHKLREDATAFQYLAPPPVDGNAPDSWSLIVRLAIDRFVAWQAKIEILLERAAFYSSTGVKDAASNFTKDYLPPLDVLYVWSAYMASPQANSRTQSRLSRLCMPWDSILKVVDLETFSYQIPLVAKQVFRTTTSQSADVLEYLNSPPVYSQDIDQDFILDLLEATRLQDNFVDRMHDALWIRSPSLTGTLYRALARYHTVARDQTYLLPTLAQENATVELVWRTHLMFPQAFSAQMDYTTASLKLESDMEDDCYCWICERIRDEVPTYIHGQPIELLKDQIALITADVGFHVHVEKFRKSNPPSEPLPTRPYTQVELEQQRIERQKKDAAGVYYGLGYVVKEVRPATYDDNGVMIKPAKVSVKRDARTVMCYYGASATMMAGT